MNSSELYDTFRSDVTDVAKPYLWSDDEVWRYMDAAYKMFVRLTGGISDFISDATQIEVAVGEKVADLHPSILRVTSAQLLSTGRSLYIANLLDMQNVSESDYGSVRRLIADDRDGPVHSMIIGRQKDKVEWVNRPVEADVVQLSVFRLPLETIVGAGQEFTDVHDTHHTYLLDWMKHLAHKKQDAETFDKGRAEQFKKDFENYCFFAKAELERMRHKTRVVEYGGI